MVRGGPRPNSGGARPNSGGSRPNTGGRRAGTGGAQPGSGGARRNAGGARPNSGGARPNTGGSRPNAGGPRSNAGGSRPNAGGSRPNAGGSRPNAGGSRPNAGGSRPNAGGPRPNAGGPRPNAGGSRPNAGGPRLNAGGPRQNAGGRRAGAGRPRRIPEPDAGSTTEHGDNIPIGPVVQAIECSSETAGSNEATTGGTTHRDTVRMRPAATAEAGLFDVFYPWDPEAETARATSSVPTQLQRVFDIRTRCSKCGDRNHNARGCTFVGWTLRITNCKWCGSVLLGKEAEGVCCGKKRSNGWGVSFKRRHTDVRLEELYQLRAFQNNTVQMNSMFAYVRPLMDMRFVQGGGPSFLKLYGNTAFVLPLKDSRYSFLWSNDQPSLRSIDQRSTLLRSAVESVDVRYFVPILYRHIRPPPSLMRDRIRDTYNFLSRSQSDANMQVNSVDVAEQAAVQGVVMEGYRGTQQGAVISEHMGGPLPEDRPGVPTYLRSYTTTPSGLYRQSAPMIQIVGNSETHQNQSGSAVVKYRKIKPSSKKAEMGAFPLLYPYGDANEPYDLKTYLQAKSGAGSSSDDPNRSKVQKLTWGEHSKRRLYTDNVLLNSSFLFQQWLLRTSTNIEDLRLEFLEMQQTTRIVEERELQGAVMDEDEPFSPGRLYLPDNHTDSPAYWRTKLQDVQALVSRRHVPSLFITITMNPWREELGRLGLDIENRSAFRPVGSKPRVFDRPDLVARVYNQFANEFIKDVEKNAEEYFGKKCVGIASKLEFQARNTPHHHILLFLEGGVIEDPDIIDQIISAELPTEDENPELRALVKKFNMHRHSPYCRGRTRSGRCRFGYEDLEVTQNTTIDETCNRVIYRRRKTEDLKVVPYNAALTKKYRAHINMERTQGGGAVAYLMKYAFKPPKPQEIDVSAGPEPQIATRNAARDNIRNDIRLYMRARVTGAVEAAWSMLEFRHVKISPTVTAYTVHLENQRSLIIRGTSGLSQLKDTGLLRYFKRPSQFHDMKFLDYMEKFRFYKTLPSRLSSDQASIPRDAGTPRNYIVPRGSDEDTVARMRFVSPSLVELFSLRLMLLDRPIKSYRDARRWEGQEYNNFRDAAAAMGLYEDSNEFERSLDEAVRMHVTPSCVRYMIVTLYQQGGDPRRMFQKHEAYLMSDIHNGSTESNRRELMRRLIEISDQHGGRLLREHRFFLAYVSLHTSANQSTELARVRTHLRTVNTSQRREYLEQKYNQLNSQQKSVFDEVLNTLRRRRNENTLETNRKAYFLQGRAGTGKTYTLSLLRDVAESKGMIVEITATTGIAAALYPGGRTLHSLLGLGIDDKESSETSRASKYGPRSQRAELIRSLSLMIVDEASMMQRKLFEHLDTILKDLRCSGDGHPPRFGGLTVVLAGDYLQLLPVVPSRRYVEDDDGNGRYINVSLLDELPWASSLWAHVKVLRMTRQVRQSNDPEFKELLFALSKGTFSQNRCLPLNSTGSTTEAYKFIWKWRTSGNHRDVLLDRLILCPTNQLVDEHNKRALEAFPGNKVKLYSCTKLQPLSSSEDRQQNPVREYVVPEMTYNFCPTGVPPHKLEIKIGAPVMVIRNVLHPKLVNGMLFIVKSSTRRMLYVASLDSDGNEVETFALHRITFQFNFHGVKVTRKQFPVRLAFAGTVHKGQGQTLRKVVVDLRSNFFSNGQLYVALSRVRKSQDVLLLHKDGDTPAGASRIHPMPVKVKNPVLRQAVEFAEHQ